MNEKENNPINIDVEKTNKFLLHKQIKKYKIYEALHRNLI